MSCQAIQVTHGALAARQVLYPAGYAMDAFHRHPEYELWYQGSGAVQCCVEEERFLLRAGSLLLLAPGCAHKFSAPGPGTARILSLHFREQDLEQLAALCPAAAVRELVAGTGWACFDRLALGQQNEIEMLLHRSILAAGCPDTAQGRALQKLLLGVLVLLLQPAGAARRHAGKTQRAGHLLAAQVQSCLNADYAQPLTLPMLAARFGVSPSYLSRAFRRDTGCGVIEYLTAVRIKAAQELLKNSAMELDAVARLCGFATPAHFRRVFKAVAGVSPGRYRRQWCATAPQT